MEHTSSSNLLDEALGLDQTNNNGRFVLIEDCVETSGAFVLHHLIKQSLSPKISSSSPTATVIFIAFSQPFSHYDRILRKLGCNLAVQKDNSKFFFVDMLMLASPDGDEGSTGESCLVALYGKIRKAVEANTLREDNRNRVTIMIDDISLMEVAANGSSNHVLNFLHYCHTLTSEFACSLVALHHADLYSSTEGGTLLLHMEYLSDLLIKVEPLATGLATDVHGQLTVLNKILRDLQPSSRNKIHNFHFKVKENNVEYFYPGSRR